MSSGNIVERLRAMAADPEGVRPDKLADELAEAADVIERLRAELDKYLPPVGAPESGLDPAPSGSQG